MPIIAPGRRINPTILRRNAIGRKAVYAGLFLTSMVDMFAIMVIFLLQSFSAEGELIILPSGLQLPKAQNVGTLERAPSLIISEDSVTLEGIEVARVKDIAAQQDWAIPNLQDALKKFKEKLDLHPPALKPNEDPQLATRKINISADRRLTFEIVRKVIYNAGFAGFPDFRFAVLGTGHPD